MTPIGTAQGHAREGVAALGRKTSHGCDTDPVRLPMQVRLF